MTALIVSMYSLGGGRQAAIERVRGRERESALLPLTSKSNMVFKNQYRVRVYEAKNELNSATISG